MWCFSSNQLEAIWQTSTPSHVTGSPVVDVMHLEVTPAHCPISFFFFFDQIRPNTAQMLWPLWTQADLRQCQRLQISSGRKLVYLDFVSRQRALLHSWVLFRSTLRVPLCWLITQEQQPTSSQLPSSWPVQDGGKFIICSVSTVWFVFCVEVVSFISEWSRIEVFFATSFVVCYSVVHLFQPFPDCLDEELNSVAFPLLSSRPTRNSVCSDVTMKVEDCEVMNSPSLASISFEMRATFLQALSAAASDGKPVATWHGKHIHCRWTCQDHIQ